MGYSSSFMNNDYVTDDMVYIIPTLSDRPVKVVFESRIDFSDRLDALLSSMRRIGISSHEAADAFSAFVDEIALQEDDELQESQELDGFLDEFTILKEQEVY